MSIHYNGSPNVESINASIAAGALGSSTTNFIAPTNYFADVGVFASTPADTDDVDKSVDSVDFAKDHGTTLIAQRSQDSFSGTAALKNGSIYPLYVQSINKQESATTAKVATAIREGKFNLSTGKFATSYPATATDSFGNDNAARASFDSPGTITFMVSGVSPTNHALEAKG